MTITFIEARQLKRNAEADPNLDAQCGLCGAVAVSNSYQCCPECEYLLGRGATMTYSISDF